MNIQEITYGSLERIGNKMYGFLIIPCILTFLKIYIITNNIKTNSFQKQFFSLLIKQSMIKFNICLSIISLLFLFIEKDTFLLSSFLLTIAISSSIIILYSLKLNLSYLQELNLNKYKQKSILQVV